jgi:hypothetical protein
MRILAVAALAALIPAVVPGAARADEPAPMPDADPLGYHSGISGYFTHWFDRANIAQAEQPHWMTPLVTVTPRLEQEFRYDQYWEKSINGADIRIYDSGKGLELIPTETNEVLLNLPAYEDRTFRRPASGFLDWQFLVVKQRLLTANEENGNYIVTAFLGFQVPSGNRAFTNHAAIITPTIAAGKGWGDFDLQATLGFPIPTNHDVTIGYSAVFNMALQYHLLKYFWPEFETNVTRWWSGQRGGKTQVLLTPGLILGRFTIQDRVKFIIGAGYQFAVSPKESFQPVVTPTYDRAWVMTGRLTF